MPYILIELFCAILSSRILHISGLIGTSVVETMTASIVVAC